MKRHLSGDWFELIPKVELHLHLEGAIPLQALWTLIQKYGGDPSVPDLNALQRRFAYRDFAHFLETWTWKNGFLREYEDFTLISEAVARDLARQNIRYVEAFYSAPDFAPQGLETQLLTGAIRAGLDMVPEIRVALIADLVRDYGPRRGARTLAQLNEVRDQGVIGIGLGGSEQKFPPEPFAAVYEEARRLGFRTNAHAGEAVGPESIWGAIHGLRVDRIGHGTRAEEDAALIDYLAQDRIPLEMNPWSNVCTGVTPSLAEHPIRRYFQRGIIVTVNTDDPQMFGNSLAKEYRMLCEKLGFTCDDIRILIRKAIQASWLSEEEKKRLDRSFTDSPTWRDAADRIKGTSDS